MKKVLSILLTLCMLSTILLSVPLSAGAAEVSEDIAATGSEDGKVLYVFGDSIAEGFLENSKYVDSWVKYVIDINGYKKDPNGFYKRKQQEEAGTLDPTVSQMIGESGLGFVRKSAWSHYYTYFLQNTDFSYADIVVVALGINDWYSNYELTTFFDHMEEVFTKIRTDNPTCELYYLLPFNVGFIGTYDRYYALNAKGDSDPEKTYGYTLSQFGSLIKQKFEQDPTFTAYNCHIIDMMECESLSRDAIRDGALYEKDNLHPIATTHQSIGDEIAPILQAHGSHLVENWAKQPSCENAGNYAYWKCDVCGRTYSDENGVNEVDESAMIRPATGHDWTYESAAWFNSENGIDAVPSDPTDPSQMNCKVVFHCPSCESNRLVDAQISIADYTAPGCTETGSVTYSATATLDDVSKTVTKTYSIPATGHTPSEDDDLYEYFPSSTYNGTLKQVYLCTKCGEASYGSEIAATHQAGRAPTCTAVGMYEYCYSGRSANRIYYRLEKVVNGTNIYKKVSGVADIRIPASHTLAAHAAVDPNCTTEGNSAYYECTVCHKYFSDENGKTEIAENSWVIPTTAHDLKAHPAVAATCTTAGNSAYWSCDQCHKFFSDADGEHEIAENSWVIGATGHNLDAHPAVAATCTTAGNSAYWSCDKCHKFFSDADGKTEIAENSWVIGATGHNLDAHPAVAATCTTAGNSAYWSCDQCHKFFSDADGEHEIAENSWVIGATGHNMTPHAAVAATCTTAGNSAYWSCDQCHKFFSDADGKTEITENSWVIGATGHNMTPHAAVAATCTTAGNSAYWSCDKCHKFFSDADGKTEIAENSWVIGATGHNMTPHAAVAATCTTAGNSAYWSCDKCHKFFSDANGEHEIAENSWVIGATGHNMTPHAAVAATCTTAGNSAYWSCDKCHKFFSDADGEHEIAENSWVIGATGHNMTPHAAVAATCTTAGNSAYWSCDQCHKFFSDANGEHEIAENSWVIGATGHNMTPHAAVAATCTAAGNSAYWSCDQCHKFFSDANGEHEIAENSWIIPATGEHHYGNPVWTWTGDDIDGYTAATVTYTCSSCEGEKAISAKVSKEFTPDSTVYTAKATGPDGQEITDTKTVLGQVFFIGNTLSLQGDIAVNFYLNLTAEQAAEGQIDFKWIVNGKENTSSVDLSKLQKPANNGYYKATCNIAPAEMSSDITATLIIGEQEVSTNIYSVPRYADVILNDADYVEAYVKQYGQPKYDALVDLIHAMFDYGTRAQERFEVDQDTPVNGGEYTFTDAVTTDMIPVTKGDMEKDLSDYGLKYNGSSVVLLTNITIRHYYLIEDQTKFDAVKDSVTFNGSPVTYTVKDGEIYFELENISARNLDKVYTLNIGGTEYTYSVFDYARSVLSKTGSDANVKTQELVTAMYYYNQKAKAYFSA